MNKIVLRPHPQLNTAVDRKTIPSVCIMYVMMYIRVYRYTEYIIYIAHLILPVKLVFIFHCACATIK